MRTDEEIILDLCDDLRLLKARSGISREERDICLSLLISEHIRAASKKGLDATEIYGSFSRLAPDSEGRERLLLCRELLKSGELVPKELSDSLLSISEETAAGSHGKVAYVRNQYNDRAFEDFSRLIQNPKPILTSSFSDTCEEVLESRCEFGIIPLENTSDGKLFSFYSMLDRYELKIAAVCLVESEDSNRNIRYGLVTKGFSEKQISLLLRKARTCRFEFSVVSEDASFTSQLFSALGECQATPLQIDSLSVQYDDNLRRFFFTVEIPPVHLRELSLYLSSEFSSYTFIGFYQVQK